MTCDTRVIHFDYTLEQLQHGRKRNIHLEMRKLEQTELQRRRTEERKAEDKTRKSENRKPRETAPGHKRGYDNELMRNLRLEKMVAGEQLRLAVDTEEERRTRLENDAAILKGWQLCLSFKLDILTI